jgi:nucleoside-diphosphate-sugar epimerase
MARVLIAGFGYVGAELGRMLADDSHSVWGLARQPGTAPGDVQKIVADLGVPRSLEDLPPHLDHVFYMASPGGSDDALYRMAYVVGLTNLLAALEQQQQRPKRIFFVSSTSVLEQRRGEWVDEDSPAEPTHFSGKRLLEGERVLRDSGYAATVVRFGGIYGPRRASMIQSVRTGRAVYRRARTTWTNRIHRDDCAGALRHLMLHASLDSLYHGVDCEPAERSEVLLWLAGALGAPPPRAVSGSDPALRAQRSNKRIRNDRLLATGYRFAYPTYREGYRTLLDELH